MAITLRRLPALRHPAALAGLLCGMACWAQPAAPVKAAPVLASTAQPAVAGPAASSPIDKKVIEDDKVRIEETRLRGQTQNVTVHSKLPGVRPYEVIMPPLGKDPSQDKGAAGKRTWSLFDF